MLNSVDSVVNFITINNIELGGGERAVTVTVTVLRGWRYLLEASREFVVV